jgi:hypothetical protein
MMQMVPDPKIKFSTCRNSSESSNGQQKCNEDPNDKRSERSLTEVDQSSRVVTQAMQKLSSKLIASPNKNRAYRFQSVRRKEHTNSMTQLNSSGLELTKQNSMQGGVCEDNILPVTMSEQPSCKSSDCVKTEIKSDYPVG